MAQVEYVERTLQATDEVTTAVNRLREIKRAQKALAAEAKVEAELIKEYIGDNYDTLYDGDVLAATYKAQEKDVFNTKAFAAKHPKLFKAFTETKTTRTLLIK